MSFTSPSHTSPICRRLKVPRPLAYVSIGILIASFATESPAQNGLPAKTAIDDYVNRPDDTFEWKVVDTVRGEAHTTFIVDMVSQTWRDENDVDRPVWQHWMTIVVPDEVKSETGFLWIGGGRNGGSPPEGANGETRQIALATGTVVAELKMVPNQRLEFHGDSKQRTEDDLIGYTWDQFLKTGDPTWPARNPMIKSAVRAMDTMTQLMASEAGGSRRVDRFVVAGGSKRGWTTWLTGAIDDRVVAIVPIVIDVLNVDPSMQHHFAAYGFWAPSIGDYVAHRITERFRHPRMEELYRLVDPFYYRHRLDMPKFIVNAAGDQFFLPDSSQFYFEELIGEKHLRYVPNTDHSLDDSDALVSIIAFYQRLLADQPRPEFSWRWTDEDTVEVKTTGNPSRVTLWQATNPDARDFRLETFGAKYTGQPLKRQENGAFVAKTTAPRQGWTAYFVELEFEADGMLPLKLTTDVRVFPDTLAFADRDPSLPASIAIVCEITEADKGESVERQLATYFKSLESDEPSSPPWLPEEHRSAEAARVVGAEWGYLERDGDSLKIGWRPSGDFRTSFEAGVGWLEASGGRDFVFSFEAIDRE